MGTQLPLAQKGADPQFSAHICCCQMARWIKMPLGREVGLGSSDIVLDGDPAPPIFRPYLLWPKGWMEQDASWYGSRPQPKPRCVRRGPSSPPRRERSTAAAPSFRPMSIVVTVAHLSYCYASAVLGVVILSLCPSVCPFVTRVFCD